MGPEVDIPPGCMYDGACMRTVAYIQRDGTFYNGRLNMSNMKNWGCRKTNKGETLINMGSEVDLPPGCIRTGPHINRVGTLYNGRLKMSNMGILGV